MIENFFAELPTGWLPSPVPNWVQWLAAVLTLGAPLPVVFKFLYRSAFLPIAARVSSTFALRVVRAKLSTASEVRDWSLNSLASIHRGQLVIGFGLAAILFSILSMPFFIKLLLEEEINLLAGIIGILFWIISWYWIYVFFLDLKLLVGLIDPKYSSELAIKYADKQRQRLGDEVIDELIREFGVDSEPESESS